MSTVQATLATEEVRSGAVVKAVGDVPVMNSSFAHDAEGVAWRSKPSWYVVANNDRTVHPDLQRFAAKRMGASTHAIDSSHVPMLSHPKFVIDVIRSAANA